MPGKGAASQNDVFALLRRGGATVSATIEGKVAESFGPTIGKWFANPSHGKRERLEAICTILVVPFPPPAHLHYQLFHRTASAVIEADRFKADEAAMVVHSFSAEHRWFEAFVAFAAQFDLAPKRGVLSTVRLPGGRRLHLGWATGDLRYAEASTND